MLNKISSCLCLGIALSIAHFSLSASQDFKSKSVQTAKPVTKLNTKAINDLKKVGQVKMLSNTEYQKKLRAHQKLKSTAVKQKATANTRLRTQNTEFDTSTHDCDDSKRGVNIGAQEICDGIDNNCDGDVDMIDGRRLTNTYYLDADSDLWGDSSKVYYACGLPEGYSERRGDCNDRSSAINPSAQEIPGNNIDENCDRVK